VGSGLGVNAGCAGAGLGAAATGAGALGTGVGAAAGVGVGAAMGCAGAGAALAAEDAALRAEGGAWISKAFRQIEQRARTPPAGILAGSTRKIVLQCVHWAFMSPRWSASCRA
jgi:hypothetical protein